MQSSEGRIGRGSWWGFELQFPCVETSLQARDCPDGPWLVRGSPPHPVTRKNTHNLWKPFQKYNCCSSQSVNIAHWTTACLRLDNHKASSWWWFRWERHPGLLCPEWWSAFSIWPLRPCRMHTWLRSEIADQSCTQKRRITGHILFSNI